MRKMFKTLLAVLPFLSLYTTSAKAETYGLGFQYKPTSTTQCSNHCHQTCKSFLTTKCSRQLQWHNQCKTYTTWANQCKTYTTWATKCAPFKRLNTTCSQNKQCYQRCVRFINNEREYTKCYGQLKCRYIPQCRSYWQVYQNCHRVPSQYTQCVRKPTNHTQCSRKPTWSTVCNKRPVFRTECTKVPAQYVKCHTTWKTTSR
ncbi:hypothetical protein L6R29_13195 [Myxococcota bacterium]|nr:hypothetical protein [Myxococcota bacterium]